MNPFEFSGPLEGGDMIDRDGETQKLLENARGRHWSRLEAPRRYGKTTLFARVLDAAAQEGMATALVDVEGVLSLGGIITRIERAYSRSLQGPVRKLVDNLFRSWGLGLSLSGPGFAVELRRNPELDHEGVLLSLLSLPEELFTRTGQRSFIVFDEVQDLLRVPGSDGIVRSVIQHHTKAASYGFSGSSPSLMQQLFEQPSAPLLEQAITLRLEPLENDIIADYITDRFAATKRDVGTALDPLINFTRGHPQRVMLLAHHVWELTAEKQSANESTWIAALDTVLHNSAHALNATWSSWPVTQQRAAVALALSPRQPMEKSMRAFVGLPHGSAHAALEALLARSDAIETKIGLRLTDPLLEYWLAQREDFV